MAYKKKTNLFKSILFSRPMALVIIFAIVFMGFGLASLAEKSIDASKARKLAESQEAALQATQTALSTKLSVLNTPDGKEAALREQFPVVKDGEHMVIITDNSDGDDVTPPPPPLPPPPPPSGFWNFLKNLF